MIKEKFTNVPSVSVVSGLYSKSAILEESYTIQLGAQLKSTHNLRLIRCNIFDFCKDRFVIDESSEIVRVSGKKGENTSDLIAELEPQAIQTAMSLYSDNLCALILLVENSFETENEHLENEDSFLNGLKTILLINFSLNFIFLICVFFNSIENSLNNAENWKYLVDICEKNGCEFHFPLIEDQRFAEFFSHDNND